MKKTVVVILAVSVLMGCQSEGIYSGNVYTADRAKQAQYVKYGTITAIRSVKIQTNANSNGSSSTALGTIGGAVIGGFLGNTIGQGSGRKLAAAGGAVAGAVAGSAFENKASTVNGVELEVREEDGATIVVVQRAAPNQFYIGQAVRIISNGQSSNVAPR